ncbi:hypothetical protein Mgra_00010086, partial [Meloidogyne graminicola]
KLNIITRDSIRKNTLPSQRKKEFLKKKNRMDFSTFIFVTTDNEEVKISKEFWDKIAFIKTFHGTGYDDIKKIHLPSNAPKTGKEQLEIILNFLKLAKKYDTLTQSSTDEETSIQWKDGFFDLLKDHQLFEVIESANFLGVTDILDSLAEYIAKRIGRLNTMEEMEAFFGYKMEEKMAKLFNQFKEENEKAHLQQEEKDKEEAEKLKKEEEKRVKVEKAWADSLNEPDAENVEDDIGLNPRFMDIFYKWIIEHLENMQYLIKPVIQSSSIKPDYKLHLHSI